MVSVPSAVIVTVGAEVNPDPLPLTDTLVIGLPLNTVKLASVVCDSSDCVMVGVVEPLYRVPCSVIVIELTAPALTVQVAVALTPLKL